MPRFSYDKSVGTMVFSSPNGATFPVSTKAVDNGSLNAVGTDMLDSLMFTMRSEPTEHNADKLDGVMFAMRSEPTEPTADKLNDIMFTMRSEPTEPTSDKLNDVMFTMRSEPVEQGAPGANRPS